jgi:hypothetical protein
MSDAMYALREFEQADTAFINFMVLGYRFMKMHSDEVHAIMNGKQGE